MQQLEFEKVEETYIDSPLTENEEEVLTQKPSQQQDSIAYRKPRREIRKHAHFINMVAYTLLVVDDDIFFHLQRSNK